MTLFFILVADIWHICYGRLFVSLHNEYEDMKMQVPTARFSDLFSLYMEDVAAVAYSQSSRSQSTVIIFPE